MKSLVMALCSGVLLLMVACSSIGLQPGGVTVPCIVDKPDGSQIELSQFCIEVREAGRVSYICNLEQDYSLDPCVLHRGLEVVSKEGLILEGYTFKEFKKWADYTKDRVKNGLSFGDLQTIVLAQFTKINKMVGAQILLLGGTFLQIPQAEIIPPDDIILVISSIDDLVVEVRGLSIWIE
jgi:hypothetical protein